MWLIGGAALYFLTRKKDPKTTPEAPSSDVGNQVNDTPSVPNNAPSTVVVAAPRVNPVVVDVRDNTAVGTPPQVVQTQSKGYSKIGRAHV